MIAHYSSPEQRVDLEELVKHAEKYSKTAFNVTRHARAKISSARARLSYVSMLSCEKDASVIVIA